MANIEVLALLCAGSTRYHAVGGRSSSGDRLAGVEVAGLLAGLDNQTMNFALAKYLGDEQAERMLLAQVRVWAVGVAVNEGWRIVRGRPCVLNMAAIAVFEAVRPNQCRRCHGNKFVGGKVCGCCHGSGIGKLSTASIAEAIGVDKSNYVRVWRGRYQQCYDYVQELDYKVLSSLNKNYREKPIATATI